MKIILVIPTVPRPFGETAAKWYFVLIKYLIEHGNKVNCFIVTNEVGDDVHTALSNLTKIAPDDRLRFFLFSQTSKIHPIIRKIRSFIWPFSETYFAPGFRKALADEMSRGYDILHLEQLWTGWLAGLAPRTILNIHCFEVIDLENRQLFSWSERKTMFQMRRATNMILRINNNIRVLTPRLLNYSKNINPLASTIVVPFALDISYYSLQEMREEPVIGMIGSMHWAPSSSAADRLISKIWPLIQKKVPAAKLLIAGWNAKKFLKKYSNIEGVIIEDGVLHPTDFFSRASVMVYAPMRGSGMKVKIMESMAYGVPVVTTWEGVEGIEYENGLHCWVDERDEIIAEYAVKLLMNRYARQKMRNAARRLIEDKYSPEPVMKKMLEMYANIQS